MSRFQNLDEVKEAASRLLGSAPNARTAQQRIHALPGPSTVRGCIGAKFDVDLPPPPSGMFLEISGVTVRFNDDGTREATFVVATQSDDPDPQSVSVFWASGFLTPE